MMIYDRPKWQLIVKKRPHINGYIFEADNQDEAKEWAEYMFNLEGVDWRVKQLKQYRN